MSRARPPSRLSEWRPPEPGAVRKARLARRAGRLARYEQMVALHAQGLSNQEIAQRLSLSERTLRSWQVVGAFPETRRRRKRQSAFDAFAPEVLRRWQAGERNGPALFRVIKAQGYNGTERTLYRHLATLRQAEIQAAANPQLLQKFSAKTAVWLFIRDPSSLDARDQEALTAWCLVSPTLKRAYRLVQDFLVMVHQRAGQRLDAWLAQVAASELPELQSFAAGVEQDKEAVQAGLTSALSNAQTERQVTKVKLIKRSMYGKAGFALLRQRVLHAGSKETHAPGYVGR